MKHRIHPYLHPSMPRAVEAVAKINSGLKPHEGLKIVVSPKTLAKLGKYAPRTVKIQLKRYVQDRRPALAVFYRGTQTVYRDLGDP